MNDFPEYQHKQPKKLNYKEKVKAGLIKGGINPMSKKKTEWNNKYIKQKQKDEEIQICPKCNLSDLKSNMEPHHPKGRANENILFYWWMHPECHAWIHAHPNEARKQNLLLM
jgi:hypothetical protein